MAEQTKPKRLSRDTKKLLKKMGKQLAKKRGTLLEFNEETGVVRDNATNYDLTSKEGREAYMAQCQKFIGFSMCLTAKMDKDRNGGRLPSHLALPYERLEPYLSICHLIDDLTFQMETMDVVDGFNDQQP